MSWSNRLSSVAALCVTTVALAGCGFHPLYGEQANGVSVNAKLATVRVLSIGDRTGQELTNQLRDNFNPRGMDVKTAYQLEVALKTTSADILARSDGTAARTDTMVYADWKLRRLSDNQVVVSGTSNSANGHDVLTNDYANVIAGQHDVETGLKIVESDIQTRVAIYLRSAT